MNHDPFFEMSVDMLGEFDALGAPLRLSPSWTIHLGWSMDELLKDSGLLLNHVHPDDRSATQQALDMVFSKEKNIPHFINRYRHKNGSYRWVSWSCMRHPSNRSFYTIARDVTDFRLERRHLRALVESLDDLVLEVDEHFQVLHSWENKNACTGFSISDIHLEVVREAILLALTENKSQIVHFCGSKDSSRFWAAKVTPLETETGGPRKVSLLIRDSTQKKRDEEAKLKAELALIQASKMASLGEMAGGVAHEINNPLSVILARAQQVKRKIAENTTDPKTWIEDLRKIESTALRIFKIVKGLRAFSRSADKDPFTHFSINQLFDETLELCRAKFHNHGVELRVKVDSGLMIDGRSIELSQVLLNLLNNAYDAVVGSQEPWVEIHAEVSDGKLVISVTDSGRGIPDVVVQKMMQPFFTTKQVGKGTGLGLSISKGIIEDHHGQLRYNLNSPHTQFVIELPLRQHSKAA